MADLTSTVGEMPVNAFYFMQLSARYLSRLTEAFLERSCASTVFAAVVRKLGKRALFSPFLPNVRSTGTRPAVAFRVQQPRSKLAGGALAILITSAWMPFATLGETLCFEAESAQEIQPPMTNAKIDETESGDEKVSGHRYLEIEQGVGDPPKVKGIAKITFEVNHNKRYYLWCRVWWLDACGNSLGLHVDDAKEFTFGEDRTFKSWHWIQAPKRLAQLELENGEHTLTLAQREDGVRIDQILLTTNKRYVPVGVEKITYTPPVKWSQFTPDGRTAHLPSRVGWE